MNFETLAYIAENINSKKILWGVGGSLVLNQYGLVDDPRDIDILVELEDFQELDRLLLTIGHKKETEATVVYSTKAYNKYRVKDMDIDVMGGFIVKHSCGEYEFPFNVEAITSIMKKDNVEIPMTSLEDWYVIYQLIPNREKKVRIIEDHFTNKGVENRKFLINALDKPLPYEVSRRIQILLKDC